MSTSCAYNKSFFSGGTAPGAFLPPALGRRGAADEAAGVGPWKDAGTAADCLDRDAVPSPQGLFFDRPPRALPPPERPPPALVHPEELSLLVAGGAPQPEEEGAAAVVCW